MSAQDLGVLVKNSPVSGLWIMYLTASHPCRSTGLKAVAPKTAGFLSVIAANPGFQVRICLYDLFQYGLLHH